MSRINTKSAVEQILDQALKAMNGNDWHAQQAEIAKLSAPDEAKTPVIFNIISMADKIPHRRADIIKVVQFMLVESARTLSLRDGRNNNFYHIAAQFMPELIESIYEENKKTKSILDGDLAMINWVNADEKSPLEIARSAAKEDVAQKLEKLGAKESALGKLKKQMSQLEKTAWEARLGGKPDPKVEGVLKSLSSQNKAGAKSKEKPKTVVASKEKKEKVEKKDSRKRKSEDAISTASNVTTMTDLPDSPNSPEKWADRRKGSKNPRGEESPTPSANSDGKPSANPKTKDKKDKAKLLGNAKGGKEAAKK